MSRRILVHQIGDPTRGNLSVELQDSHDLFKRDGQHRLRLHLGEGHYLDNMLVQHVSADEDGSFSVPVEGRKK